MKDLASTTLVVIPAFNAAEALQALLPDVTTYICPDNLLVVDDGSTDTTRDVLRNADVNYIAFRRNRGKGAALRAAYQYALRQNYRSVLSLDADRQHDPDCIPSFLAADTGRHLVLGRREFQASPMPPARRISNYTTSLIVSAFALDTVHDSQCGFRLVPTDLIRRLRLSALSFDLESQLLFQAGLLDYPTVELSVPTRPAEHGSAINHVSDTFRFIHQIWRRIWY